MWSAAVILLCQVYIRASRTYGSNICGEGGEYESLTLDCPLFTRARLVLQVLLWQGHTRYSQRSTSHTQWHVGERSSQSLA